MKLLIIRHADPDYAVDSLTETGWKEAALLVPRLEKLDIRAVYVSPMGRARDTASLTLKALGQEAQVLPWLREFRSDFTFPNGTEQNRCWDWHPADWTAEPRFFDRDAWCLPDCFRNAGIRQEYDWVIENFDALLAKHGYVREGQIYRAQQPNHDTVALFCHFGLECVLLSRLLNVSPMVLWHGTCASPSSVTVLTTEERQDGVAYFRMSAFGDTSHLYAGGREPSFAGRFCETYADTDQRH